MAPHLTRNREASSRLFTGLDPEAQRTVIAAATRRKLRAGQVVYRVGEQAEALFVLSAGCVHLSRPVRTGRDVLFSVLMPGDVFGLVCLLTRRTAYMGTAKVVDAGEAMVWDHATVQRLVRQYPQLTANALTVAIGLVVQFADRHELLVANNATERVAHALSRLGTQNGEGSSAGIEVQINNEQLASLADVSAFTVSRVLQQWERDGAVKKTRGAVRIVNPEGLLPQ
jgi:CRP-like cAMP-binding protein